MTGPAIIDETGAPGEEDRMTATETAHIRLDEHGTAWIDDTQVKVVEVALDEIAHGWSAQEIHLQHRSLSLAQIHAALSYYHDHREWLDAEIERRSIRSEILRGQSAATPSRDDLHRRKRASDTAA
jgi:uncharacterized protein (DUF433 family)